ncbi:MAG: hypothetical protein ACRED5_04670, partial [Propylenella sp.]
MRYLPAPAPHAPHGPRGPSGNPDSAYERMALTLWNSGRKEDAVEFLSREVARRKSASLRDFSAIIDVVPEPVAPPRPRKIPRRPFFLGAALATASLAIFVGGDRIAALPGLFFAPEPVEIASAAVDEPGGAPVHTGSIAKPEKTAVAAAEPKTPVAATPDPPRAPRAKPEPPAAIASVDPRRDNAPRVENRQPQRPSWMEAERRRQLAARRALAERQAAIQRYQAWARAHGPNWDGPSTYYFYYG